jgi:hypothetical protein
VRWNIVTQTVLTVLPRACLPSHEVRQIIGESSRPSAKISSISKPRYYSLGIGCCWDRRRADRGTMAIRVEVWGFLGMGAVAVSDHLRLDAV